jgi:site-specific recombinase XerD
VARAPPRRPRPRDAPAPGPPFGELAVERALATARPASLIDVRDVAVVLVVRDCLARRSEVAALQAEDVRVEADGSGTVLLRRSKTDQEDQGAVAYLAPRTMAAVTRWIDSAGLTAGPLFRAVQVTGRVAPSALGAGDISRVIKKLAARAGLNAQEVSGHSCRVGMAQDLVAAGVEPPAVMQVGRWQTAAMPARYAERRSPAGAWWHSTTRGAGNKSRSRGVTHTQGQNGGEP